MSDSAQILPYEQHPEPPYLVREPGRVALVLPPVRRSHATIITAMLGVFWLASVAWGVMVVVAWVRILQPTLAMTVTAAVFGVAPLFMGWELLKEVRRLPDPSRYRRMLEVAGGELVVHSPAAVKAFRMPVSRVRKVRFVNARGIGLGVRVLRMRVWFEGRLFPFQDSFSTPDQALLREVEQAFRQALGQP
jgi:hypothetical protein